MRFTKYNSMDDILAYPNMREYLHIFFSEYIFSMFPKKSSNLPIARQEQIAKTPWGEPFSIMADQLMDAVNLVLDLNENHRYKAVALWEEEGEEWKIEKQDKGGKDSVFLIAPVSGKKEEQSRKPAVIICPGGGYEEVCFSGEGTPILHFMEANGYVAFILRYRVGKDAAYPAPQEDLAKAVCYVRAHAEEYGIDPADVMVLGASAGGHLCASEAALFTPGFQRHADPEIIKWMKEGDFQNARPDKVCLCYPVISLSEEAHEGSANALVGQDKKRRQQLSVEHMVTADYPPVFVWACADDDCVPPSNAVRMGEALKDAAVSCELRIYPSGGHGCALAFSKEACDWSQEMLEFFRTFVS